MKQLLEPGHAVFLDVALQKTGKLDFTGVAGSRRRFHADNVLDFVTTDDVHQLRRNGSLPSLIVYQGEILKHIIAGFGRIIHSHHSRCMFTGGCFQQGTINLNIHISGQQLS